MRPLIKISENTAERRVKTVIGYAAVFACSAVTAAAVEWFPMFRDPDSFYHLKMALLLRDSGIVRDFRWLPFTTLVSDFADHHFLYHVLLVPFVTFMDPMRGMLVATALLAATALTLFYAMLRAYGVRHAAAFVFILGSASAFLFRLDLSKASALSLSLLFLALIAIRKRSPLALFVISWIYVLSYGGWPVVLAAAGAFLLARMIADRLVDVHPWRSWAHRWFWKRLFSRRAHAWKEFVAEPETRLAAAAVGGVACGLVVNPYFPANLSFYWEQIVQIAFVGYRGVIGVGSEWYPFTFDRIAGESGGALLLWAMVLATLTFMLFWPETVRRGRAGIKREELVPIMASAFLTALFLCLTLRSKRHMEYFVPFAVFSAALAAQALRDRLDPVAAQARLRRLFPHAAKHLVAIASALMAFFLLIGIRDVAAIHDLYAQGIPWDKYKGATAWIAAHAPADAVVLQSDWDDFPLLFYRDDGRRYIIGLDPTFMYRKSPADYRLWVDVTQGRVTHPVAAMRDKFDARYALIEKDHRAMLDAFDGDPRAKRSYEDGDAVVFTLL